MRRLALCAVVAAGIVAATASSASAMIMPACAARLAPAGTASCTFQENSGWALITVEPTNATVTAAIRCTTSWGYTYAASHEFSSPGIWNANAPGSCTLSLSSADPLAVATATASPWERIYTEPV